MRAVGRRWATEQWGQGWGSSAQVWTLTPVLLSPPSGTGSWEAPRFSLRVSPWGWWPATLHRVGLS